MNHCSASAGLQIGITGLNIVMNVVEIILISQKRMPPGLFLTSACIKTGIWGIIFILNAIAHSALSIILTIVLLYVYAAYHPILARNFDGDDATGIRS